MSSLIKSHYISNYNGSIYNRFNITAEIDSDQLDNEEYCSPL